MIKKSFSGSTKKRFAFKKRKLFKKKVCYFCAKKIKEIDYKDVLLFRKNITDRGKILSQRISGACAKHQRCLSKAIKRARIVGLLPFSSA